MKAISLNKLVTEVIINVQCVFWLLLSILLFQAIHLETETISYEEKELQLVNDCVKELREYWID